MNINTVHNAMHKRAWDLPAGANQYLRYQNPNDSRYAAPAPIKPVQPKPVPQPYSGGNPAWNNKPKWQTPEGYSNKGWWGQVGDNLKTWFKQKAWDAGHAVDTAFGTGMTAGKKRPGTGNSREWGFFDYAFPGLGLARDLTSGLGGIFNTKPTIETQQRVLPDWQKRMMAESKGQLQGVSNNRHDYDKKIELPDNKVFQQMAEQEALGEQYDDLRRRGYNQGQIANYIMQQKYLPLVRHATGKQNIIPTMKLTDENWKTIKAEMLKRQQRGLKENFNRPNKDTGLSNARYNDADMAKEYENALAQTMDAKIDAMRKFQDPSKVEVNYSDLIKNNPAMLDAIRRTSNNVW